MELPIDIWDIIVKQSKKSNSEFIKDKNLNELYELEYEIKEKIKKIYDTIKSKLKKYDIIKVTHKTDKKAYKCVLFNFYRDHKISVAHLIKCNEKGIFGNYNIVRDMFNSQFRSYIDLNNVDIEVISSLEDRNKENIKFANSLNIGDVFIYYDYRNYFDSSSSSFSPIRYSVVEDMTAEKLIIKNHTFIRRDERCITIFNRNKQYINKNKVLKKLNFHDNKKLYINLKKDYFMDKINTAIRCEKNYNHFDKINKEYIKQLINLQRKLKIRP